MKTIINGYLQQDLVNANVDLVDIEIIKYFQQFAMSKNMKHLEHEGQLYYWLSYQKLIDDLPIINIKSKRTIARRFKDLVDKGIFDRQVVNVKMKNYTYFRLTELHQSWVENMDKIFEQPKQPISEDLETSAKEKRFNEFWKLYPKKNNKPDARRAYNKITLKQHDLIIKDLPKRIVSEDWSKDNGKWIPYAQKYINQKQWNNPMKPANQPKQEQENYLGIEEI